MIVQMARVRVAGPRAVLDRALAEVQDAGVLHVVRPAVKATLEATPARAQRHLRHLLDDVDAALALLCGAAPARTVPPLEPQSPPLAARLARAVRRQAERLARQLAAVEDERLLLLRYREFFTAFESLLGHELAWADGHAFYVVLRAGAADAVTPLRASLEKAVGAELELLARPLASGETAVLLLVPKPVAAKVAQLLSESRVQELPAPASLGETNLLRAMPKLKARLAELPELKRKHEAARAELREAYEDALLGLRAWLHDRLLVLEARAQAHAGPHLFVIEGWTPRAQFVPLANRLSSALGPEVVVEVVETQPWSRADAPVALQNPPLFKPFEVVTRMLPLPKYGTIDPTPFVAVFFPMFFGLMLGDVGYGLVLAALAVVLRLRSKPNTTLRSVAAVAGACAAFTTIFGVIFGELFGTLGQALGMRALFNREESVVPFLVACVGLGVVHILLGLVLAAVSTWRQGHKRAAMGRGVALFMVAFSVLSLLAAFEVLPEKLFTPFVIAVLVAFPVLVALEGVVAVIELLSTYGHILSYARIMALGTASLMLAVVANQMVGAMGSVVIGVVFALLFHIVNFAIGVFSPTIHALRLHYVEFFGKFYSPGGTAYHPLAHWQPSKQGG